METERFIERISKFFANKEEAACRLDSIAFIASERFKPKAIRKNLKDICRIALSYEDQISALKTLERVYAEGIENSKALLSNSHLTVRSLYQRLKNFYEGNKKMLHPKGMEIAAEQELLGFDSIPIPPSGTGQVYHQRVGRGRTS